MPKVRTNNPKVVKISYSNLLQKSYNKLHLV